VAGQLNHFDNTFFEIRGKFKEPAGDHLRRLKSNMKDGTLKK